MHGIPVGLKDLVDVEGKATTGGSKVLQSNIATSNAAVTNRLNRAGAITVGKTNLVEMALGSAGVNPYTGDAHNPWDTDKITGGSSSGSGAAVAGGLVYGALGSDTGGSIRMPASLCGLAGLKPTYGRVPRTGVLDLSWSKDPRRSHDTSYRRLCTHAQRYRRTRPARLRIVESTSPRLRGPTSIKVWTDYGSAYLNTISSTLTSSNPKFCQASMRLSTCSPTMARRSFPFRWNGSHKAGL